MSCSPSLTANPADSWPRCWSANSPSAAIEAASVGSPPGRTTPKTPHIRSALPAEAARETMVPGMTEVAQRDLERIGDATTAVLGVASGTGHDQLDHQPVAADRPDGLDRQAMLASQQLQRRDVAWPARQHQARRA